MKKEKRELLRVQSILEKDRMKSGDDFLELVTSDIGGLLCEYFDFCGEPTVRLEKFGDRYRVDISILATRIKSFDSVPK